LNIIYINYTEVCKILSKNLEYIDSINKKIIVKKLLKWWKKNKRVFPWRKTNNLYNILIAEILLQRTKAEQVVPVYRKIIHSFPNFTYLLKTSLANLEKILFPLGLSEEKAKRLKELAFIVINNYSGQIPSNINQLKKLPGVGEYIARAVLCFGYKEKIAIIDVNVVRIYKRYFGITTKSDIRRNKSFIDFSDSIITKYPDLFNYSLLDFAALICKSGNPLCFICPLTKTCIEYQTKSS